MLPCPTTLRFSLSSPVLSSLGGGGEGGITSYTVIRNAVGGGFSFYLFVFLSFKKTKTHHFFGFPPPPPHDAVIIIIIIIIESFGNYSLIKFRVEISSFLACTDTICMGWRLEICEFSIKKIVAK